MSVVADRQMICRVKLDPAICAIPQTANWLREQFAAKSSWDMSRIVVGLPTSRACRRLLELLVEISDQKKLTLVPPAIRTIGQVPEFLYKLKQPLASDMMQRLAWTNALGNLSDHDVKMIGPRSADNLAWADRFAVSGLVQDLHRELAGSMLSFRDVLKLASEKTHFRDHDRWEVLHRLQMEYFKQMRAVGVWDIQTARRMAVMNNECQTDKKIVLVGSVDLNQTMRKMLEQVSEHIQLLVVEDKTTSEGFDELGCLRPDFWEQLSIEVKDSQLRIGDRPTDQSQIMVDFLGRLQGKFSASQISIAIPDHELTPFVTRALTSAGVSSHDSSGETINATAPVRLLRQVSKWLLSERFVDLANLVRHEVVFARISEQLGTTAWLSDLDRLNNRRCPLKMELGKRAGDSIIDQLINELSMLIGDSSTFRLTKKISEWAIVWRELLQRCFKGHSVDRNDANSKHLLSSLRYLNMVLADTESIDEQFDVSCKATDSLLTILTLLAERQVVADRCVDDIELVGWLDLAWDDSQVAIVTAFNEGKIPSSRNFHPFLPNSLRSHLGLLDNRMRYARDKFALSMLLKNRERLLLIGGRRDSFENPLLPSRLLFTGDAPLDARRVLKIIHQSESQATGNNVAQRSEKQQFAIPKLPPIKEQLTLSVTDFDAYLNCPYRFYLSRILQLRSIEDRIEEMDPAMFGNLAHHTLDRFGKSDLKDSTDAKQIRNFLREELRNQFRSEFDRNALPAIHIQLTQLEMRLDAFAEIQSRHRQAGWSIVETEIPKLEKELVVDGEAILIRGRIDRVDWNEKLGRQAIIDYKTSRRHATKTQIGKEGWKSLQLPLYHWLVEGTQYDKSAPMDIGFGRLSPVLDEVEIDIKEWSTEELQAAMSQVMDVVRLIRRNEFTPNPKPPYSDEFDGICQNRVFEKWVQEEGASK